MKNIEFDVLQTLVRGKKVIIKDSPDKEHILGRGHCDNLNLIEHYIEQLNNDNIIVYIQENEMSDLFIETNCRLKNLWEK